MPSTRLRQHGHEHTDTPTTHDRHPLAANRWHVLRGMRAPRDTRPGRHLRRGRCARRSRLFHRAPRRRASPCARQGPHPRRVTCGVRRAPGRRTGEGRPRRTRPAGSVQPRGWLLPHAPWPACRSLTPEGAITDDGLPATVGRPPCVCWIVSLRGLPHRQPRHPCSTATPRTSISRRAAAYWGLIMRASRHTHAQTSSATSVGGTPDAS